MGARPGPRVPWQAKFLSLAFIWGASFLFMKYGLRWFAPIQIGAARIFLGAITVLTLLRLTGGHLPRGWYVWKHLIVVAVFLAAVPFVLFPLGEERVSSALAGIGNAITPIATVVVTMALIPPERLAGRRILAVVIGFLGVVVIAAPWESADGPDLVGFGITLLAGSSYGIGWTWVRKYLARADLGGLQLPAAMLLVAAAQMVIVVTVWWVLHRADHAAPWSPRPDAIGSGVAPLLALLALGVVGTGIAYLFQFDVFRAVGQQVGSLVTYLIPIVSVALGYLVLGERLGRWQLVGAVIVLGAAIAVSWPSRRDHPRERRRVRAPSPSGSSPN